MSSHSGDPASAVLFPPQRTFLGHPLGLYVLFFTEMWRRFNYYGMRALLMLYMVNSFRWSQQDASAVYKLFTSFVYVTPILGGYLADRLLGNRWAVIIGASMMAVGQFMMTFETTSIFMLALGLLIIGNGFFKPNMSTQVGRLYPTNDGRLDGAYTIFYMGINLGAFFAPLVCGWLMDNTEGSYHAGFLAAGIGMLLGLVIYLLGQPLIRPVPAGIVPEKPASASQLPNSTALTEEQAAQAPSVFGRFTAFIPVILAVLGAALIIIAPVLWLINHQNLVTSIGNNLMLASGGVCLLLMAFVAGKVVRGVRDRVVAVLLLGVFVIFFWGAYEQAGNVQNVWADKNTDRYLTERPPPAELAPPLKEWTTQAAPEPVGFFQRLANIFRLKPQPAQSWKDWLNNQLNPVPTAWFQSINSAAIVLLAPLFAWLWIVLDRRGWQPSIPMKMVFGLILMSAAMAIMMGAAREENRPTSLALGEVPLPPGIEVNDKGQLGYVTEKGEQGVFQAGRLTYDPATGTLNLHGVLSDNDADLIIEKTAPADFRQKVLELEKASEKMESEGKKKVEMKLDHVPPGFDMRFAKLEPSAEQPRPVVRYQAADHTLVAYEPMAEKEVKGLLTAGGEPRFREKVAELYSKSQHAQVNSWWLFWSYILATLGELCLSPVGLSMASKLAPARYDTTLMGVWLLITAFGNFLAGSLGEIWGTIAPESFFLLATVVVAVSAVVLLLLVRLIASMMHGVR